MKSEGPQIRIIPESNERVCNGCSYLKADAGVRGRFVHSNNFTCTHSEFKDEHPLLSMKSGRTIHFHHEGDCNTPSWCPFLKSNKSKNETTKGIE